MYRTAFFMSLAAVALLTQAGQAHERSAAAHVHGAVDLDVVVNGDEIAVSLAIPSADAVGFEHPPADPAQEARLAEALARLADPLTLFGPDTACTVSAIEIDDHDFEPGHAHHGHASLEARYRFTCTAPATALTLGLFDAFPSAQSVEAQVLVGSSAFKRVLNAASPRLDLTP